MTEAKRTHDKRWFTPVADPSKALKIAGTHTRDADPFFTAHPYKGVIDFGDGRAITWPFRAQSVDATMFWGTADANAVTRLLAGTGMNAATVKGADGVAKPLMQVWYLHYNDTSLAAQNDPKCQYKEFLALLTVTDQPSASLPYTNGFSTTLGATVPGAKVFELSLLLDNKLATEAGRDTAGLDKQFAPKMEEVNTKVGTANQLTVAILDSHGKPLVKIAANVDPAKMTTEIPDILKAYGFTSPAQLAQLPTEAEVEIVNKDVRGGTALVLWNMWSSTVHGGMVMHSVGTADGIQVLGKSDLGWQIKDLKFTPEIVGFTPGMMGSYEVQGLDALAAKYAKPGH